MQGYPLAQQLGGPRGVPGRGQENYGSLSAVQELSRVKAAALSERGQAEEELIKAKNQVRLEEVSPWPGKAGPHCLWCPPGSEAWEAAVHRPDPGCLSAP